MQEVTRKKRIISYDVARTLAIFLVVLCHATELTYTLCFKQPELVGGSTKLIASALFTLGRLGVPLFLFLTGALVLKKQINKDDDVLVFYRKNLLPLVVVNFSWVIIYNIFFLLNGHSDYVSIGNIIKEALFMKTVPLMNMWYIPMIVGIYIGIPFVAKLVKLFSKKSLLIGTFIVFVSCFIFPFISFLMKTRGISPEYQPITVLDLSFLGGTYGLYILIGNWIANEKECKIKSLWLVIGTIASFLSACAWQVFTKSPGSHPEYSIWYNCPFILISGIGIFMLINSINFSKLNKKVISFITFISKSSLAVFFIHIILQTILTSIIAPLQIFMLAKFAILLVTSFCGSILICYILGKSKILSRYVLLIKN